MIIHHNGIDADLTCASSASSHGLPVLVIDGQAYGVADIVGSSTASDFVSAWATTRKLTTLQRDLVERFLSQLPRRVVDRPTRIRMAMLQSGIRAVDIAQALGVSRPSITNFINGARHSQAFDDWIKQHLKI